jgi:predicted ATPase
VERYRSFVRKTTVELRPLTLLFGYNSAGKSSLLRALPLLATSGGGAQRGPLNLGAEVAREAGYADIRSHLAARNDLVLSATWDDAVSSIRALELHFREDGKQHILGEVIARGAYDTPPVRITDIPERPGRYQFEAPQEGASPELPITFDGLRPRVEPVHGAAHPMLGVIEACASRIASLQASVHWLGAVRSPLARLMKYRGDPLTLGGLGQNAADKIAYDHQGKQVIFPTVDRLMQEMFGHRLRVRDEGEEYALEVELPSISNAPNRASLVDTGEGVTQVLPVLVLCAMAGAGLLGDNPVLAIEQPEMHLHPRAERALAQLLCSVIRAPSKPRVLLETHSENLLLFIQLEVARKALREQEVSLLWVRMQEADRQSLVDTVTLDEQGRLQGWPEGVFSEDVEMARALFTARRGSPR